jgi:hypothetical protein
VGCWRGHTVPGAPAASPPPVREDAKDAKIMKIFYQCVDSAPRSFSMFHIALKIE